MVTLITANPQKTKQAINAAISALENDVSGFLGLHLEGPHLSLEKSGAHDRALIRPMNNTDLQMLLAAKQQLPVLMVTIAPETVSTSQISALTKAGIIVSIGHANTSYESAKQAVDAGASCFTHLFNAMSPLQHREPGVVGAALDLGGVYAGLIADGHHVNRAAISIALAAKSKPGEIFLVTDAMANVGTNMTSFMLNDHKVYRKNGCLRFEDGTLAGADLDMASAVRFMHETIGLHLTQAIKMATTYPAQCAGVYGEHGNLKTGAWANIVHLSKSTFAGDVWIKGRLMG